MQNTYFDVDALPTLEAATGTWLGSGLPPKERKNTGWGIEKPEPVDPSIMDDKAAERAEDVIVAFCKVARCARSWVCTKCNGSDAAKYRGALIWYLYTLAGITQDQIAPLVGLANKNSVFGSLQSTRQRKRFPQYAEWIESLNPYLA